MRQGNRITWAVVIALACIAAAALWWWTRHAPAPVVERPVVSGEVTTASAPQPAAAASAEAPPAPEPPSASAPIAADGIRQALVGLLGEKTVLSVLLLDEFPRRFVATVDNLGRAHAPSMLWPVRPTGGRFVVIERDGAAVVSPDNALRYTPFVLMFEHIDSSAAADLYVQLLPLLQQAYEDIGFPRDRFHTRLLAVIDQLLAAPEPTEPITVTHTEVKGPIPSVRPWVRYEFVDPALESASAGQKIMVRIGTVNERRVKAKLGEFRREIVKRSGKPAGG